MTMPEKIYVFNDPKSIGDMGLTVTELKTDHIEYTRADLVPAVDLGMVFKSMNDILDLSSGIGPLDGENLSKDVSIDNICRKVRAHLEAAGVKS